MVLLKEQQFDVGGMTCAACQANVEKCVLKLDGVKNVDVSLLSNSMKVEYDEDKVDEDKISLAVENIGYSASAKGKKKESEGFKKEWDDRQKRVQDEQKHAKQRLVYSLILLVPLMLIAMGPMMGIPILAGEENAMISSITQLLLATIILFIQNHFFVHGFKALIKRAPNMDSLVAIGSLASYVYGLYSVYRMAYGFGYGNMEMVHHAMHALYFESAAMIVTLVSVGKYLESRSKSKTTDALSKLVDLAPKSATVIRDGKEILVSASEVMQGDIVVIKPGQKIPVDGKIVSGTGYVDQSTITGESIPVEKQPGDMVISATLNQNGSFKFEALKVGDDTTLAQIIRLVDEAGNSKAPIARLADKVSGIFVPIVIGIAIVTAIVWLALGQSFEFALSNAISVLVISCPCALGLATPVAIMVGTGKAASQGILIKSAQSLETLHSVDTIVLDKTGTITSGKPSIQNIVKYKDMSDDAFLTLAASIEQGSEHPLALAILSKAKQKQLSLKSVEEFEAVGGKGVKAKIDGQTYFAGNSVFIKENGISFNEKDIEKLADEGKTPLIFTDKTEALGIIAVADTIRNTSKAAIQEFKQKGLHVVMLTGDNQRTAKAVAQGLHIDEVISDVLPADKESVIRRLQSEQRKVMMVGDGINDAPALMRADIGVAIGQGTDIAIDSADIVLMKNSLLDVNTAIDLSTAIIRNIKMNLFWAFFYNFLGIPVAAGVFYPLFGWLLSPMIGSAAMSLSSVCVVTNALRLRFFKPSVINVKDEETIIEKEEVKTMKKTMIVDGMMCQNCVRHVKNALEGVDGVISANVDLDSKSAEIEMSQKIADEVLFNAVKEEGYTPIEIH